MNLDHASPRDEPWIRQLLIQCGLPQEDITPEHLRHFWVLKEGAAVIGSIGLEILGRSALLRSLAVDPRFRKRGYGSALAQRAEDYAATMKVEVLFLLTMTAEGFFQKRGYQRADRTSIPPEIQGTVEFQKLCPASSICMMKRLSL